MTLSSLHRHILEFQPSAAIRGDNITGAIFTFTPLKLAEGLPEDPLVGMAARMEGWATPLAVHPGSLKKPKLGEVWGCNVDGRGFVWPMLKLEG